MSGELVIAHMDMCATFSSSVFCVDSAVKLKSPIPTSKKSGSFHWPGEATNPRPLRLSRLCITLAQFDWMSALDRHLFANSGAATVKSGREGEREREGGDQETQIMLHQSVFLAMEKTREASNHANFTLPI